MNFGRVVGGGFKDALQDIAEVRIIAEKLQQRFAIRAIDADPEQVFRCGIERLNQQVVIEDDDRGIEAVEYLVVARRITVRGFL